MSRQLTLLAILICLQSTIGLSQEPASKPWWNPFASEESSDASVRESTFFNGSKAKSTSMFSMPKLPWSSGSSKPKGESSLNKFGKTTKKMWNGTLDFVNPFNDQPAPKVQQGYQPQSLAKQKSPGMFSWMWPEEPKEPPSSVNEFLRQPRPTF